MCSRSPIYPIFLPVLTQILDIVYFFRFFMQIYQKQTYILIPSLTTQKVLYYPLFLTLLFSNNITLGKLSKSSYRKHPHCLLFVEYFIVQTCHSSFNQYPTDRHQGCFQSFATSNKATMKTPKHMLCCKYTGISVINSQKSYSEKGICLGIFLEIANLLSVGVVSFCISTTNVSQMQHGKSYSSL